MDHRLHKLLAEVLSEEVFTYSSLSGGDISSVYRIETKDHRFVLKIKAGQDALPLFEAERTGLQAISDTGTIHTPRVMHCGALAECAVLIMDYIETKQASSTDLANLGHQLARLHWITNAQFGWPSDNFIGSLRQCNTWHSDWTMFYTERRLIPQFRMALDKGLLTASEIPDEAVINDVLRNLFGEIRPSLLHGDLWGGNYLIASDGTPYLIDPAVYYGHHEVDLAMSKLFGGFGRSFYDAFAEVIPEKEGAEARNDIYQLYYLLVHLNLFGSAYRQLVMRIVRRYFK
ncbi:MAG TPA: fructosamine kinase family protein [Saprospiraceae bacterium]|nr:fructosamine kinase family protein [Saprospiraceae bacterium]